MIATDGVMPDGYMEFHLLPRDARAIWTAATEWTGDLGPRAPIVALFRLIDANLTFPMRVGDHLELTHYGHVVPGFPRVSAPQWRCTYQEWANPHYGAIHGRALRPADCKSYTSLFHQPSVENVQRLIHGLDVVPIAEGPMRNFSLNIYMGEVIAIACTRGETSWHLMVSRARALHRPDTDDWTDDPMDIGGQYTEGELMAERAEASDEIGLQMSLDTSSVKSEMLGAIRAFLLAAQYSRESGAELMGICRWAWPVGSPGWDASDRAPGRYDMESMAMQPTILVIRYLLECERRRLRLAGQQNWRVERIENDIRRLHGSWWNRYGSGLD